MEHQLFIMKYINRISRCNAAVYDARLKEYHLTKSQHPYIRIICRQPGITQEQITRQLYVHPSSVTRQLAILEKKGLIRREQGPNDRRVSHVYPTPKMEQLFPLAQAVMKDWNNKLLEGCTEEEKQMLFSVLERMLRRAEQAADEVLGGDAH